MMLTCQEVTELVTDYLEGKQSMVQRMRFQFHLGMCHHCRGYLQQMRFAISALNRLPAEVAPPPMPPEILERLRSWKKIP